MVKLHVEVFPFPSFAVKVINWDVPAPDKTVPATGDCVTTGEDAQLSVTVADVV
jgi:hypothetical protein